ncbi:MAG: hypothetical protein PUG51_00160 [Firmicutes bacterium]|nr:hypothetical protein [Bacillota bacterium]
MKKFISILLSLTVITTCSIPCYASSHPYDANKDFSIEATAISLINDSTLITSSEKEEVVNDLERLEKINIDTSLVTEIDKLNNDLVYKIEFEDLPVNTITILEATNDYTIYSFKEGDKHDILKVTSDNEYYLDGNLIEIETTTLNLGAEYSITPYGANSDVIYTDTNPLPSAVWVQQRVEKTANIELKKIIETCTTTLLLALLTGALGTVSRAFASCFDMAANVISAATGTNSTAMSSKISIYYPQGGRHVGGQKYIEKHIGRFWPKKNYQGTLTLKTRYEITQYY